LTKKQERFMSTLTIVALGLVAIVFIFVLARLFGQPSIRPLLPGDLSPDKRKTPEGRISSTADSAYQEVLNLADVVLEHNETVYAATGLRGDTETVLLVTNLRVFYFTRRFGASRYSHDVFAFDKLHPIPVSQAVIGENIRLLEGDRMAEMKSPGAESWLDTAEDTIKIINQQIKRARTAQ